MSEVEVVPPDRPIAGLVSHCGTSFMGRKNLLGLPTPEPTDTHKPIAHAALVGALIEALGYRRLNVVEDQYAVSPDGMRMFGVLALDIEEDGVRVSIGIRNSHDKSFALGITIGYRVFVCDNLAFRSEEHTSELQSQSNLVCRLLLESNHEKSNSFEPRETWTSERAVRLSIRRASYLPVPSYSTCTSACADITSSAPSACCCLQSACS